MLLGKEVSVTEDAIAICLKCLSLRVFSDGISSPMVLPTS